MYLLLQVAVEKSKLCVGVKGQTAILDGDLYAAVKPDDSFWNSDGTALEITLQKVRDLGCNACAAREHAGSQCLMYDSVEGSLLWPGWDFCSAPGRLV